MGSCVSSRKRPDHRIPQPERASKEEAYGSASTEKLAESSQENGHKKSGTSNDIKELPSIGDNDGYGSVSEMSDKEIVDRDSHKSSSFKDDVSSIESQEKVKSEVNLENEEKKANTEEDDKYKVENQDYQIGLNHVEKDEQEKNIPGSEKLEEIEWKLSLVCEDRNDILIKILNGYLNVDVPSQLQLVRIFTSSTFTDTFWERNMLMEKVYPKLRNYCQSKGYDFQVVDMRWGVRDASTNDHMTTELCMKELEACQKFSTGPNFITFLGQKYGYRPFPRLINEKEFDVMLSSIQGDEDVDLLNKWFVRDDSLVPSAYILQPIRDLLPNYNNYDVSDAERAKASEIWWTAFERMQVVLREASENCLVNDEEVSKYTISVTENEIRRGILDMKDRKDHCFWFNRNITDLRDNVEKAKAKMFIDKISNVVDEEAAELLRRLRSNLSAVLENENIKEYDVSWHGEDCINPNENDDHNLYIERLGSDFFDVLADMIDKGIAKREDDVMEDDLLKEIVLHTETCQSKTAAFYGRKNVLESIINHFESDDESRILVIHGKSGCGKTSLMASAARMIKEMYPEVPLVLRFLGTTAASSDVSDVIRSICTQIGRILGESITEFPESLRELATYFEELLKKVKSKMVIMLDSLDQLSSIDSTLNLKWIPRQVKKHLTIILSTLPGAKYGVLPILQARLPQEAFIDVPGLSDDTAGLILDAWAKKAKRRFNRKQREVVVTSFSNCPLPLFLKLSFDQALKWKSYTPESETNLPATIKQAIVHIFEGIERLHGERLVQRSLAYLTAARNGLSDSEMDDILSLDDNVLNDVYQYWTPPIRRIPPLLWIRIKADLESYIVARGTDGISVNAWYQRQFFKIARQRYLPEDEVQGIHRRMAEFFLGSWSEGLPKPYVNKSGDRCEMDRLVPMQPNMFAEREDGQSVFNYRKLNELPHHLIKSGDVNFLKKHVVTNFDFLQSKLRAVGWRSVLQDLKEAAVVFDNDKEIELLRDCWQMSGETLLADCDQLAAQLNGRLGHMHHYEWIHALLMQSRLAHVPCLYPSPCCFDGPGGAFALTLAGHTAMISWASFSTNGKHLVTISEDETLKLWDITTGEEISSHEMDTDYDIVKFYNNNTCVVVTGYYGLFTMDLATDDVIFREETLEGFHGKCMDVVDGETKIVHAGKEKIRVYEIDGRDIKLAWEYDDEAEENPQGIEDVITGDGNLYGYTRGNEKEVNIRRTDDKDFKKVLEVPYGLMHFKFHDNKLITLGTNSAFQEYAEIHLVIWDCSTWNIVDDKESRFHPVLTTMYDMAVTKIGDALQLIWPIYNQVIFWDLKSGEERLAMTTSSYTSAYKQCLMGAGRRLAVVMAGANQRAVNTYNYDFISFEEKSNLVTGEAQLQNGLGKGEREAFLNQYNPNIILSMPYNDPVITIWDTRYEDCIKKIHVENGYPHIAEWIDKDHIALWDLQRCKIACVNITQGTVRCMSSGKTSILLTHYQGYQHLGDFKFLTISDAGNELDVWDMKTGNRVKNFKINGPGTITSFAVSEDCSTVVVSLSDSTSGESMFSCVCFNLNSQSVCSEISVPDEWIRLLPEQTISSADGKILYLTFWQSCIYVIDTETGKEATKIWYCAKKAEDDASREHWKEYTQFYCINSSHVLDYLVAYLTCTVADNDEEEVTKSRLVVFDLNTHEVLAWHDCRVYDKMQISKDGSRMLCRSQALNNQPMALDLWDMSKVRDHKLTLIGKFLPDSNLRFSHLTLDGKSVCCGFSGVDGLVFLRLCGESQSFERPIDSCELRVRLPDEN